jgi:hypothetical protein
VPRLITPNGGEVWRARERREILWISDQNGTVTLEFSPYFTVPRPWFVIASGVPDKGTFEWNLPNISSRVMLVRVTEEDGGASDQSDGQFTVQEIPREFSEGTLALSASREVIQSQLIVETAEVFEFVLLVDIDFSQTVNPVQTGMGAWECRVLIPPEVVVVGRTLLPTSSINVADETDEWIVGTGSASPSAASSWSNTARSASSYCLSVQIELAGTTPSSFVDGGPGWAGGGLTCGG